MHLKVNMLSGDSTVRYFSFNGENLECYYDDDETDRVYKVEVKTPIIYSEKTGGEDCVHMRLESSAGKLDIDERSGLFVLPSDFGKQMGAIRKGYHVLAGLKASEYTQVFILYGAGIIALCPIKNEACVAIKNA